MNYDINNQPACKDKTEMFYVDEGPISSKSVRLAIAKAVAICNKCPVQDLCLVQAINNKEEYGIWGGFTSKERKEYFAGKKQIDINQAKELVRWKKTLVSR